MGLIITIINAIVTVITFTVIIYTFLRFLLDPYHPIIRGLGGVIEPILSPIRKHVPPMGGFDFSPLILIIAIQVLGSILVTLLRSLG
jgi:YggT family protein